VFDKEYRHYDFLCTAKPSNPVAATYGLCEKGRYMRTSNSLFSTQPVRHHLQTLVMYKKDYYSILEIERTASGDEVRKAYHRLAMKYHPDRNPEDKSAEDAFKEISEAYAVLGDQRKRRNYDHYGQRDHGRNYARDDLYEWMSAADLFDQTFFARGGMFGGCGCGRGRRRFWGRGAEEPGGQTMHELPLEAHEAAQGAVRELIVRNGLQVRRVVVRIPPKVEDGAVFRVTTDGRSGLRGDILLRIRIV